MPLPDLIEIVPVTRPVAAAVGLPGSKSITNRALILAALAQGRVVLEGALWSDDTRIMTEALLKLGLTIGIEPDPAEACNRIITVDGLGGRIPGGGTATNPLELFVGNAGTAARFLAALVCLGDGVCRLSGVPRMHERPQAALFSALRQLGYRVESEAGEAGNDRLPARIFGEGSHPAPDGARRHCRVSIEQSSQFASALLLGSRTGGWEVTVEGENAEESPYVAMTSDLLATFPWTGGRLAIEPDASSGSYFLGAGWLLSRTGAGGQRSGMISAPGWPASGLQMDARFPKVVPADGRPMPAVISRTQDLGDSIMTAIVLAAFNPAPVTFVELGRLRVQECERVAALRAELTKCGVRVVEAGDTLTIHPAAPGALRGAEIETYHDHRMAMCFAVLGLKIPGIRLKNPACVKKTFPDFFQKLAARPPEGLGVEIRAAATGRALGAAELLAD